MMIKLFIALCFLQFGCEEVKTLEKSNDKEIIIIKKDSLSFFSKSFFKYNDTAQLIFFSSKCIESVSKNYEISKKINTNMKGEDCNPLYVINKLNKAALIFQIDSILKNDNTLNNDLFIKRFETWKLDDKFILNFSELLKHTSEDFFLEQVLYNYSKTKLFYSKYLESKNQYWGSLSPNDFCQIYFDVLVWLNTTSTEEKKQFYQYLFKEGQKTMSKKQK